MSGVRVSELPTECRVVTVLRCRDVSLRPPTVELRLGVLTYEQPHLSCLVLGYSSLWHCWQWHLPTGMSGLALDHLIHHVIL